MKKISYKDKMKCRLLDEFIECSKGENNEKHKTKKE